MADSGPCTVACCVLLLLGSSLVLWNSFAGAADFYRNQRPGRCIDGRLSSEPLSAVTGLGVDVSAKSKHGDAVRLRCVFRVAFYPCSDGGDYIDYDGSCGDLATAPSVTDRAAWHLRHGEETGVTCGRGISDTCTSDSWACTGVGSCNAYEKSVRICASQLREDAYPCFGISDDAGAGVRTDAAPFPAGQLAGGVLSSLAFLACCGAFLWTISEQENFTGKVLASVCCTAVTVGVCVVISAAAGTLMRGGTDERPPEVRFETTLMELADSLGGSNASDALASLQSEAPIESIDWWSIVLIVLGCIVGLLGLCCCCLVLFEVARRAGERARETAAGAAASEELAGGLTLGCKVCLSEDWVLKVPAGRFEEARTP